MSNKSEQTLEKEEEEDRKVEREKENENQLLRTNIPGNIRKALRQQLP